MGAATAGNESVGRKEGAKINQELKIKNQKLGQWQ